MPHVIATPAGAKSAGFKDLKLNWRSPRLRRSAVAEMAIFFLVLAGLDYGMADGHRFIGVAPHPCWLIVILASVVYGLQTGLAAALLSTAFLLVGNLPDQTMDQDGYAYVFGLSQLPLMWLMAAFVFGGVRQRQLRERAELQARLAETTEQRDVLAGSYGQLKGAKELLEVQIAGSSQTLSAVYRAAGGLDKTDRAEVIAGASELVRAVLKATQFSLFALRDGALRPDITFGWDARTSPAEIGAATPLFDAMVRRRCLLAASNPEDRAALDGQGVMAAPLIAPDGGEVVGMLKVEQMPLQDFTASAIGNIALLCEWIASAYERASRFAVISAGSMVDAETSFMSPHFFERQTAYLAAVADRAGFEVSVAEIAVEAWSAASPRERRQRAGWVAEAAKATLRQTDQIFAHGSHGHLFRLLLPNTNTVDAEAVVGRLVATLRAQVGDRGQGLAVAVIVRPLQSEGGGS